MFDAMPQTKIDSLDCDDCQLKFDDFETFHSHRLLHHKKLIGKVDNKLAYKDCYSCPLCPNWWDAKHLGIRQLICTDNLFKCVICPKLFFSEKDFRKHSKTHIRIIEFPCSLCRKRCSNRATLDKHMRNAHSRTDRLYICDLCPKVFTRPSNLKYHRRIHVATDRISCPHCNRNFCRTGDLNRHIRRMHSNSKTVHRCNICSKLFANEEYLTNHEKNHTETGIHCIHCKRQFVSQTLLNRHIQNVHLKNIQSLTCTYCKEVFIQLADLRIHRKSCKYKSAAKRKFECDQCRKQFVCNRNLQAHLNIHTDSSPHVCGFCQKKFTSRSNLKEHRKIHTRLWGDFECELCLKRFFTEQGLRYHQYIHTGEKPFRCDLCLKTFGFLALLKRHLRHSHSPLTTKIGMSS